MCHRSVIQNLKHLQKGKGNMEATGFPKMQASLYQTTRRHNPKQSILPRPHHMSLTSSMSVSLKCLMSFPLCIPLRHWMSTFIANLHDRQQRYRTGTATMACCCIATLLIAYWSQSFTWLHWKVYWEIYVTLTSELNLNFAKTGEYSDVTTNKYKTSLCIKTLHRLIKDVKAKPRILDFDRIWKCMARIAFNLLDHTINVTGKWFGPSAEMHGLAGKDICSLKTNLFWDFTQHRLVVCYRPFGTTYEVESKIIRNVAT
jgi:hypothetical protein